MRSHVFNKLTSFLKPKQPYRSFLRYVTSGKAVNTSDLNGAHSVQDIRQKIQSMRALAQDAQIGTALSYYATDSTIANSAGQIIWATSKDKSNSKLADIINKLFQKWKVNLYARDHILEIATVGNLYIPTTQMYKEMSSQNIREGVALDNNTIADDNFDILPAYKLPAEEVLHLWSVGSPLGFVYKPDDDSTNIITCAETAIIHFSLGGLLGDYTIDCKTSDGTVETCDIQFAEPLLNNAIYPTQTLNLLEDASLLAAFIRVVKFINVDCSGAEEEEIQDILQQVKQAIEQQLSVNTNTGNAQSFLNPQSPNNLIYLPKVNGQDAVSITDLNMAESNESENKLLDYYQNKKLSVLGIPKEALNFSSAEGLGAAGTVMSQRSALYANILDRLKTAYITGWTDALNKYFKVHNMSGFCDQFELHMNPVVTAQSTIMFEKRDAALSQALQYVQLLQTAGDSATKDLLIGLTEILTDAFPQIGAAVNGWEVNMEAENGGVGNVGM